MSVPVATITPDGPTTFCQGDSVILSSGIPTGDLWSTGSTNDSITVMSSGNYTLTLTNACGADTTTMSVLVNPTTINPVITANGPTTFCPGDSVILSSNFATGNVWSTGATTQSITVNTGGVYTLTVTTSCATAVVSQTVTVSTVVTASIVPSGATTFCQGDSLILSSTYPSGNTWSTSATTQTISVKASGIYSLTVNATCGSSTDTIQINVLPTPNASITVNGSTSICAGDSVQLLGSGGGSYLWSTGSTNSSIYVKTAGTYTLGTMGFCGPAISSPVTITITQPPVAAISGGGTVCQGDSLLLNASGGSTYVWSTGSTQASIYAKTSGTYTVVAINACGTSTTTALVNVSSVTANFSATPVSGTAPLNVTFTDNSSSNAVSHDWNFDDGGNSNLTSPAHTFNSAGTYTVSLSTENNEGCTSTYTLLIVVQDQASNLVIPNVFTPNGDGKNDFFTIDAHNVEDFNMTIYDRWGKLVNEINDAKTGWNGQNKGGDDVSAGTYYYVITAKGTDSKTFDEKGSVTLMR